MAFNNTVPYTIDGTIDTNTNLITFVVSRYNLDRRTNLYDDLQWTEQFSIPAGAVVYKRDTDQVFILQNTNQDQFSIYQGWYDLQADVHYSSITVALDNMVDALVAQNTGGGEGKGGTLYYDLTEAAAIAALGGGGVVTGALYRITLDGSSGGAENDILFVKALDSFYFDTSMGYYDDANGVLGTVQGVFKGSGFAFTAADATLTTSGNVQYNFDPATDALELSFFTPNYIYGIVEIAITANETLETITGGFEGMELTIFVTGGTANALNVADTGNIIVDLNFYSPPVAILDNNLAYIKLKKRGSNWILMHTLTI
jgi:hypothetical protein